MDLFLLPICTLWLLPFRIQFNPAENDLIFVTSMLWPRKGSLMKTQTRILDNRLYYTRKIELHRKGKKSRTDQITPILICLLAAKSLVLIMVRRVHYGDMGKAPTTLSHRWNKSNDIFFSLTYSSITGAKMKFVTQHISKQLYWFQDAKVYLEPQCLKSQIDYKNYYSPLDIQVE